MYQHILVCIDGSEVSPLVLEHAIDVAGRHAAKIHVANVVDTRNWPSFENLTQTEEQLKQAAHAKAEEAVKQFIEKSGLPETQFDVIVEAGSPRSIITKKIAKNVGADLIIIGASSVRGLDHLVVGSVASAVLRTATCDVLVVRRP